MPGPYDSVLAAAPGLSAIESVDEHEVRARDHAGRLVRIDRGTFDQLTRGALQGASPAPLLADNTPAQPAPDGPAALQQSRAVPDIEPYQYGAMEGGARDARRTTGPAVDAPAMSQLDADVARRNSNPTFADIAAPPAPDATTPATAAGAQRDATGFNVGVGEGPAADPNQIVYSTPGGMVETGGTVQTQSGVDLSAQQQQLRDASAAQQAGVIDMSAAEAAGKALVAKQQSDAADINADFAARRQRVADAGAQEQRRIFAEVSQIRDELDSGAIDPNRVWANKSTGGKVASVIGMLLSGIGSGLTGKDNLAMRVLDDEIERDIDAQKANLANKRAGMSDRINALGAAQTIVSSELEAVDIARITALSAVDAQIKSIASMTDSEAIKGRAMEASGQIQEKIALHSAALAEKSAERIASSMAVRRVGGQHVTLGQAQGGQDFAAGDRELFVPELQGFAMSKDDAKAMKSTSENVGKMRGLLGELRAIGKDATQQGRAQAIAKELQGLKKEEMQLGAMSDGDKAMLTDMIPDDPSDWDELLAGQRLGQVDKQLAGALENMARARGLQPAYNVPDWARRGGRGARARADAEMVDID